eukprot:jgi/Tetstr1/420473/TSEL_011586.t1
MEARTLHPMHARLRIQPHELAWAGESAPDELRRDVWFARMLLRQIPKHDRAWIAVSRLQRDAAVYYGGHVPGEAFAIAARRMGARWSATHVGFDIRGADRLMHAFVLREL